MPREKTGALFVLVNQTVEPVLTLTSWEFQICTCFLLSLQLFVVTSMVLYCLIICFLFTFVSVEKARMLNFELSFLCPERIKIHPFFQTPFAAFKALWSQTLVCPG